MLSKHIKTLKTIDYFGQLLLISVALVSITVLGFTSHSDTPVFTALVYSVSIVLTAQLLSCIVNRIGLSSPYRHQYRYLYELIFGVFAVLFISQFIITTALIIMLGYFFYLSPLLSFSYLSICYKEYKYVLSAIP